MKVAYDPHGTAGDSFWELSQGCRGRRQRRTKNIQLMIYYRGAQTATKGAQTDISKRGPSEHMSTRIAGTQVNDAGIPDAERQPSRSAGGLAPHVASMLERTGRKQRPYRVLSARIRLIAGAGSADKLMQRARRSAICVDQQQGAVSLKARWRGIKIDLSRARDLRLYVFTGDGHGGGQGSPSGQLQQSPER